MLEKKNTESDISFQIDEKKQILSCLFYEIYNNKDKNYEHTLQYLLFQRKSST